MIFCRLLTGSLEMEKAKPTENLVLRRGSGRTRPDLRRTYRSQGTNDPVLYCFHFFFSQLDEPRVRARRKTGRFLVLILSHFVLIAFKKFQFSFFCDQLQSHCRHRFSAKEGAKRVDQARPRTNIQVDHCALQGSTNRDLKLTRSDPRWQVWRREERGSWQVQRQGGRQTQRAGKTTNSYAGNMKS